MSTTTPDSITSQASSKLDQRDSGMPRIAGSSQAIAVTSQYFALALSVATNNT
jgi:hypothetical protein